MLWSNLKDMKQTMVIMLMTKTMRIRMKMVDDDICKHLDKTREGGDRGEAVSFQCTLKGSGNI